MRVSYRVSQITRLYEKGKISKNRFLRSAMLRIASVEMTTKWIPVFGSGGGKK